MIWANKKDFIFRQGNCTMNVLHPSLSKSFALNICSKDPMKNSTLGYFCKITYSQMHCKFQPWCLFGIWLLCSVLWFDFFYPHITSHVLFAKSFKHLRRKGLRKSEKYTSLWFLKKRLLYLMGGKYKWILPKNMLSSSLVGIISLRRFLL